MTELAHPPLSAWESFNVIVGTSGGALIGLQFVVVTIIADRRRFTSLDALQRVQDADRTGAAAHRHSQRLGFGHAHRRLECASR